MPGESGHHSLRGLIEKRLCPNERPACDGWPSFAGDNIQTEAIALMLATVACPNICESVNLDMQRISFCRLRR
jgi:hypothetical protein